MTTLDEAAISRMPVQDLYDLGPKVVAALPADTWETREAILAEYFRDVSAGYEPPLREPDAYPPGFVAGLSEADGCTLLDLQATDGRAAVLAARQRMVSVHWRPLRTPDPHVYLLGQPGESYGQPVMVCDE